ncbi:glycosyltransferase [uncultured Draconibacterium sp.]|uniref:glycosyltransferase n=1 Tax=uncultured Draconibacterium sp. TaxID=1573823 RepID=UPI0025D4A880|nr:glycosyltransferase [uncultured Draconibacterium sp.]
MATKMSFNKTIAVVIPCYKVKKHILKVIDKLPEYIDFIIVIDDKCPEETGKFVEKECSDSRVKIVYNKVNMGVGGATKNGYRSAHDLGADIIIKIDGDDQMDTTNIPKLIKPIQENKADYTKGNRFFYLSELKSMPSIRLFGNSILSMINKGVRGYWSITDPTNGFTALNSKVLIYISLDKIENRYFFESDMLFRLATCRAVVQDIPMHAKYGDEVSNLSIWKTAIAFPLKYLPRFFKRLFYTYVLRDFNIGTLHLIFGTIFLIFGVIFGSIVWIKSIQTGVAASTGTIMICVLPVILGFQMLLSFISHDMHNQPKVPLNQLD